MAPADPIKLFDQKLNKNESEFDRSIFIQKETVCALQHLYVKLIQEKIKIIWILRSILNLFLASRSF